MSAFASQLATFFAAPPFFTSILVAWRIILAHGPAGGAGYIDPRFRRVLWYLIGSTKGGANRAKILELLNKTPSNPNQLATQLDMDYKTIIHHLKVLSENGLIITDNKESYGATYFLTPLMENNYASFAEILTKMEPKRDVG